MNTRRGFVYLVVGASVGGLINEFPDELQTLAEQPTNADVFESDTKNQSSTGTETETATSTTESTSTTDSEPTPQVQSDGVHRQGAWLDLDQSQVEEKVHEYINEFRGGRPIRYDKRLGRIARYHSYNMARKDFFSHTSPSGNDFLDRYNRFGYDCRVETSGRKYSEGGENLAATWAFETVKTDDGTTTYSNESELAQGIVNQWKNSQRHRENMQKSHWRNEGIGVWFTLTDGKVRVFVTQNFC